MNVCGSCRVCPQKYGGFSLEYDISGAEPVYFWDYATRKSIPPSEHTTYIEFCNANRKAASKT